MKQEPDLRCWCVSPSSVSSFELINAVLHITPHKACKVHQNPND